MCGIFYVQLRDGLSQFRREGEEANKRLLADLGTRISALHQYSVNCRDDSKLRMTQSPPPPALQQSTEEMERLRKQVDTLQTRMETLQQTVYHIVKIFCG